jgi:predicted amidohydrolase YtcJ
MLYRSSLALALAVTPLPAQQAPDLILYHGKVVTLDRAGTIAQAVAIAGGKFVAVGATQAIRRLAGPHTEQRDLAHRTVIPGLADNHYHSIGGGHGVDLSHARRLDDVLKAIAGRAAQAPPGEPIVTNSDWHEDQLVEQRLPYRDELDRAAPDRAVVVVRGGHEYVLNSAGLERWHIDARTPEPTGGKFGRYPDGRLNGELVDRAKALVRLPPEPPQSLEGEIAAQADEFRRLNAYGLTAIRYAGVPIAFYRTLAELRRRGLLTIRINLLLRLPNGAEPENLDSILTTWNVRPDEGDEWLRIVGMKLVADGGFEGGWMRKPYEEPFGQDGAYRGLQTVEPEWYRAIVLALNRRGWRIATHAVGDAAIDFVLDTYQAASRDRPIAGKRWAIEHAFVSDADQIPRIHALGLALSVQDHLYVAAPSLVRYWGRARAEQVTPVKTYLDAGLPLSSGTDSPVIPVNPFWTLYHFITRGTISGGVMGADQRIGRVEALRLATTGFAYLTFQEPDQGTIERGKRADLVVLSDDILTCPEAHIERLRAMMTVVGGKIVYRAPDLGP